MTGPGGGSAHHETDYRSVGPIGPVCRHVGNPNTCRHCAAERDDYDRDPLCQCQGCGAWASIQRLGESHNCHRNADGTYEEGGTFQ